MNRAKKSNFQLTQLEDRSVPAVVASVVNGTLFVTGQPSSPMSAVRIEAELGPVRVFDGGTPVGVFSQIRSLSVRPDGDVNLKVNLGSSQSFDALDIAFNRGIHDVSLTGRVTKTTVTGGNGIERIVANGWQGQWLQTNTGLNNDQLTVFGSRIDQIDARSVENVQLESGALGQVVIENFDGSTGTNVTASINKNLTVNSRGGSLVINSAIGGNVAYSAYRGTSAVTLKVAGRINGDLQMTGTEYMLCRKISRKAGGLRMMSDRADMMPPAGTKIVNPHQTLCRPSMVRPVSGTGRAGISVYFCALHEHAPLPSGRRCHHPRVQ